MLTNMILPGDIFDRIKDLPDESIQCCITSPPYYKMRSYLSEDDPLKHLEIGLEASIEVYIEKLVRVFQEVHRVLRNDGVLWINIGDSYACANTRPNKVQGNPKFNERRPSRALTKMPIHGIPEGVKKKNLLGIPWRVAFALQAQGWILRSDIIWHKSNAMPESCLDRPTKSHEYLFLLVKSEKYFYDADAIRTPLKDRTYTTFGSKHQPQGNDSLGKVKSDNWGSSLKERKPRLNGNGEIAGANKRTVWDVASSTFKGAHFAVMPKGLVEPCILAGSSSQACEHCGAPWKRATETTPMVIRHGPKAGKYGSRTTDGISGTLIAPGERKTVGFEPTCSCSNNTGSGKCIILDPFCGSGTVPVVAIKNGRSYIGIELSEEYVRLAEQRINGEVMVHAAG